MCLEPCSLLSKGTCILINSMYFLGAWRGRHFCSVGEWLPSSLLKADNDFVDSCHFLADFKLLVVPL